MADPTAADWKAAAALEVERTAAELGADAHLVLPASPFMIAGEVDGAQFYLRAHSGKYVVVVASDAAPPHDPWAAETIGITVAHGLSEGLQVDGRIQPARAVRVAVGVVRTWQRRRTCAHDHDAGARYCRACGLALVDPALP